MQLEHDFTIEQPLDAVWEVLTDLSNVARALPGASIEDVDSDGTHHGLLRVKLGNFSTQFRGSARYEQIDPLERRVVLVGEGQSAHGRAGLRIEGQAQALGSNNTSVSLVSSVELNGRIAQFGASMATDVARGILDRFVTNLAALFDEASAGSERQPAAGGAPSGGRPALDDAALDLGGVLVPPAFRDPKVLIALGASVIIGWLLGRRRPSPVQMIDPSQWRA